jgi:S-adenosylmethionine hydrolase
MEMPLSAPVFLLTDFGHDDAYVGLVKSVISSIAPQSPIIDLTHSIPPGDLGRAAFELWRAKPFLPQSCVVCTVVDPGVGSERRALAMEWEDRSFIGPDNGVFTYLLATSPPPAIVSLESEEYWRLPISRTFHGRDIFAPSSAHRATGVALKQLGPPAQNLVRLPLPALDLIEGPEVHGEILHTDRFGNLITSLGVLRIEGTDLLLEPWLPHCPPARLPRLGLHVRLPNGDNLEISQTFSDVSPGDTVAYIGSAGLLEIGINQGRAVDELPLSPGHEIILTYKG